MTCILTGDIVGSKKAKNNNWIDGLKQLFLNQGNSPLSWEIYRGDEFQLEIKKTEHAILTSILIKAYLRSIGLDVRIGIGIGEKTHNAKRITESNGSAFVNSGEAFENLKSTKINLAIQSKNKKIDKELNLMLQLGLSFMDKWLKQQAEFVHYAIENPSLSQEQLGIKLGINQAAVSRRRKRANYDLIEQMNAFFIEKLKILHE